MRLFQFRDASLDRTHLFFFFTVHLSIAAFDYLSLHYINFNIILYNIDPDEKCLIFFNIYSTQGAFRQSYALIWRFIECELNFFRGRRGRTRCYVSQRVKIASVLRIDNFYIDIKDSQGIYFKDL